MDFSMFGLPQPTTQTQTQPPKGMPEPVQENRPVMEVPITPAPAVSAGLVLPETAPLPIDNAGNPELIKDPLNACITFLINTLLENGTEGSSVIVPFSGMNWYSPRSNTPVTFEAFRSRVRSVVGPRRPFIRQSLIRYASGGWDEVRQGIELTLINKEA